MTPATAATGRLATVRQVGRDLGQRVRDELNSAVFELRGPAEFRAVWEHVDSVGGFSRERADTVVLYALAKNLPGTGCVVEIGSFLGRSTAVLAQAVRGRGQGRVVAIDPHRGGSGDVDSQDPTGAASTLPLMRHNLHRLGLLDLVDIECATATDAAGTWSHGPVRLLFIDGLHTYDAVQADFAAVEPHLDAGAVVVFDDYRPRQYPGLVRAVDELVLAGRVPAPTRRINRYRVCGVRQWREILR
ncbi:class I SAM-dependent methyltransferase [Virgisporangium aurantiacum]|uniref:Methyltransferase domain-containing protein n=1 Tax=Virgisporangium aurantiacum TaxID=175570 RepID=A0A8J3ZIN6_9ACTN|nr:class I SAM-dependent methyltransferase [Virgisporangium aurantiacum]GIJ62240.1 hypothetical protein Vau01_097560 [Virgisporangium aurantiacum]